MESHKQGKKKFKLSILHWNINGTISKLTEFKKFLEDNKPDLISLNETKLDEQKANYFLRFEGYSTVFKCRKNEGGGGVAILIKEGIEFVVLDKYDYLNLELVGIKFLMNKKETFFFSYYNKPSFNLNCELFYDLDSSNIDYVVCGDLNARSSLIGCHGTNPNGDLLNVILENTSAVPVFKMGSPTFFRGDYSETLDRVYSRTESWRASVSKQRPRLY